MITSSVIPSILATYLSSTRKNSYDTENNNVSSNNYTKIISNNCLCYNGYLLYIIQDCCDEFTCYNNFYFISFDDFILDLFKYSFRNKKEDYEKELHNILSYFFENKYLKINNIKYRLIII